ncbi:MAG: helix-turn-helix domain-containing protein [Verrucomicrobia bacterium]|nr:helix-turn-helix domain-containing protein [Verrucomicrobiota bacterium]MDA1006923.1 helix-turn-helix domain-containing protein [Verrucomicrobiota bacterium]
MSFNPLLKSQDVAEFFNVSSRTVLVWYYKGLIPARIHVGKVIRFDLDDVFEALEKASRKGCKWRCESEVSESVRSI